MTERYDAIVAGTGFASSFFLLKFLQKSKKNAKILVLERGTYDTHQWQIENKSPSSIPYTSLFTTRNKTKRWHFSPGFGGSSKIWWACTPRFMPNDFRLKSAYGVGKDWPIGYDDLEPYYFEVEDAMAVSGPDNNHLFPRNRPYPQPPHRLSDPDKILESAFPGFYFAQPTARARAETANRQACCAVGYCSLCPVDAKFTILNEMAHIYRDPRVKLLTEATAAFIETRGETVAAVNYLEKGKAARANADLIVLGAGSLYNPFILLKSGLDHPMLGRNLNEQVSKYAIVELDGVDNYQGSTSITGQGYMLYDGDHRRERAACLIESYSIPHLNMLRSEKGKWRQRMRLKFICEDIPSEQNYVKIGADNPDLPEIVYTDHSDYAQKSIEKIPELAAEILRPLPVEEIVVDDKIAVTDGHMIGTTVMGDDPRDSIVDKHLMHHRYRNLLILGSGSFPASSPANPALTVSALSLWAADHL